MRLLGIKEGPGATIAESGGEGSIAHRMDRILELRQSLLAAISPVPASLLPVEEAQGLHLAEAARAQRPAPPFTCSAMDGYAVRAAEAVAGAELPVGAALYAGDLPPGPLPPGTAMRIFTGAPLPPGADAVVQEERVERRDDRIRFGHATRRGENVRPAGEDVPAGGEALPAGTRLGPRALALLAAVGAGEVRVHRRPRVVVLSTGDEIVRGRTPDSNGVAVAGLAAAAGCTVRRRSVGDDPDEVLRAVHAALAEADALVTLGGVSVGERDQVPAALRRRGADIRIHGVPMKPGKPFLFAVAGGVPVMGLPGSPSACLVAFEVFARPALLRLAGAGSVLRPAVRVPLAEPLEGRAGRARFVWARIDGAGRACPLGRDAAQVRGPALADALLAVPADAGDLAAGGEVTAWLLGDA